MNPMQPAPEDFAHQLEERRVQMQKARAMVYAAHSRTGLLRNFLRRIAGRSLRDPR
jgi:hypothetical protein